GVEGAGEVDGGAGAVVVDDGAADRVGGAGADLRPVVAVPAGQALDGADAGGDEGAAGDQDRLGGAGGVGVEGDHAQGRGVEALAQRAELLAVERRDAGRVLRADAGEVAGDDHLAVVHADGGDRGVGAAAEIGPVLAVPAGDVGGVDAPRGRERAAGDQFRALAQVEDGQGV